MGVNVVGASAGSLPRSRVRPEKPWRLWGSWIPAHEEPGSIFGLLHPTHAWFPWSVRWHLFPRDLCVLGHLYLSCRNSQNKCVVSQRWGSPCGHGQQSPQPGLQCQCNIRRYLSSRHQEKKTALLIKYMSMVYWVHDMTRIRFTVLLIKSNSWLISTIVPNKCFI